jgi:DNA-binding NtrC family response regulator
MKNILIVDDEPIIRDLCVQFLSMGGYQVDACSSGEEALRTIAGQPYDLLILDLCLKGMNGLDTLKRVRSIAPQTEAVVLSGALNLYEVELQRARHDGVLGTLGKPFSLNDLSAMVEHALMRSSRAA